MNGVLEMEVGIGKQAKSRGRTRFRYLIQFPLLTQLRTIAEQSQFCLSNSYVSLKLWGPTAGSAGNVVSTPQLEATHGIRFCLSWLYVGLKHKSMHNVILVLLHSAYTRSNDRVNNLSVGVAQINKSTACTCEVLHFLSLLWKQTIHLAVVRISVHMHGYASFAFMVYKIWPALTFDGPFRKSSDINLTLSWRSQRDCY